jgi:hypothetical protein
METTETDTGNRRGILSFSYSERQGDPRHSRQRGSARGQMQKSPAGKFHGDLPEVVLRHHPTSVLHPPRGPLSLDVESDRWLKAAIRVESGL